MTSFLAPATIDAFAHMQEDNLPFVCVIERSTATKNASGNPIENFATIQTVNCRLVASGLQPNQTETADAFPAILLWKVLVPRGTDVQPNDRLTVTGTVGAVPFTSIFEVVGASGPRTNETIRIVTARQRL